MFRYSLSLSDFEYSNDYVLLSEVQYSPDEFNSICKEIIKTATLDFIDKLDFECYHDHDHTMMQIQESSYSGNKISCWSNDDYNMIDNHTTHIFSLFLEKGFFREFLPIETMFHANIYTYIGENFSDEIINKISDVCSTKNKLIVRTVEEEIALQTKVESAQSLDEAKEIIRNWKYEQ